jgi:hypothetical protein
MRYGLEQIEVIMKKSWFNSIFSTLLAGVALLCPNTVTAGGLKEFLDEPASGVDQSIDWSGFFVGLGIGRGYVKDPHTEYMSGTRNTNGYAGLNEDSSNPITISIGYNWGIDDFVFGFEGRIQRRNYDDSVFQTNFGVIDDDYSSIYQSKISKQALLHLGRVVNKEYQLYMSAGRVSTEYTRKYISIRGQDTFVDSEYGSILGFGVDRVLANNYSIRGEINKIWYEQTTHSPINAWSTFDDVHDATETTLTVSIIRRF